MALGDTRIHALATRPLGERHMSPYAWCVAAHAWLHEPACDAADLHAALSVRMRSCLSDCGSRAMDARATRKVT